MRFLLTNLKKLIVILLWTTVDKTNILLLQDNKKSIFTQINSPNSNKGLYK